MRADADHLGVVDAGLPVGVRVGDVELVVGVGLVELSGLLELLVHVGVLGVRQGDGGLDGVIETTDPMGFREKMLLQMKNRYSPISPKDVREFYGAVCIARGSRGIFVTISTFHPEAQRLLEQVDNLIGVDGAKLFAIAAYCGMGVRSTPAGARLDPALFLEKSL